MDLVLDAIQHSEHAVFVAENLDDPRCGPDVKRLQLTQKQESEDVIKISAG